MEFQIQTIEERGPLLPLGIEGPGGLIKEVETKPWRMKEERQLGDLREKNKGLNVASFVTIILAHLCRKLGPYDFEAMKFDERRLVIGQMAMGDVYFSHSWLRLCSLGSDLPMDLTCPRCDNEFPFVADVGTIEVKSVESLEQSHWEYELRDSLELRGKKIDLLAMGPTRWNALENVAGGSLNTGIAKAALIKGAIREAVGLENAVLTDHELDEMSKYDLERLINLIDANSPGPDLSVEAECPRCGGNVIEVIDWGYDSFFATSSRSRR